MDLNAWVSTLGYMGITAIIFAETGLFFCFFFPGDSLLFTAGLMASRGVFQINWLIGLIISAAFLGYMLAYFVGRYLGGWLSSRPDTWYFKKKYLHHAHAFYNKYGKKALLIGRLVPVLRTFIPVVAGMIKMPFRTYTVFNFFGAVIWGVVVPLLGYFLGAMLPDANRYLLLVVFVIIVLSILPGVIDWLKHRKRSVS